MLSSCMMADEEVFTDPFGHVGLSVRGYVYFRPDEPAASQSVSVHVYDRSDYGFASPLAVADEVSAYDGYYEADMNFVLTGDILIKVFPEDKTGGAEPYVTALYSWSDKFYDDDKGSYFCNMPPLYLDSGLQ